MSKRLQVVMDDVEYAEIEAAAGREEETVSQWVRHALRRARRQAPEEARLRKLAAIRSARGLDHPTGDIDQLLEETERGYLA